MPDVDLADDTWIAAAPDAVARAVTDPANWARWWPELELQLDEDRGDEGVRWLLRGQLRGTMEIWLEPRFEGVVLHYFLRADYPGGRRRRADRDRRRHALRAKRNFWALKDALEGRADRAPEPRR